MALTDKTVTWERKGGYECSSKGDKRFSALFARMPDGRTLEMHYQCDVKGYQPGGTDWRLGKGKPPLDQTKDLYAEYFKLWCIWANNNEQLVLELAEHAKKNGYVLTDMFATTPINQARALADILNTATLIQPEIKEENKMRIAIIGTAGRDKTKPMTLRTWNWMLGLAREIIPEGSHLVSGGAAWADHIAVQLFLEGHAANLTLHLPAPLTSTGYLGDYGTSGNAANYYHKKFADIIGVNTFEQLIKCASHDNCTGSIQEVSQGYSAMFVRNKAIVQELNPHTDYMFAFTFGTEGVADGGTKNTWDMFNSSNKHHFQIPIFN